MKSKKLRKLVASVAMIAMTLTVIPTNVQANAATDSAQACRDQWNVNVGKNIEIYNKGQAAVLDASATKTKEDVLSVEKIETSVLTAKTVVKTGDKNQPTYDTNDSEGGVARIGMRLSGDLESRLRTDIDNAISEHRKNVNKVNANQHNSTGTKPETKYQKILADKLYSALNVKDAENNNLNDGVKFIVTYELSDGRVRTTSVLLSDLTLDVPNISNVNSSEDLNSLVDENGLVYFTLRGLPTDATITNIELDSRKDLTVATNNLNDKENKSTEYSVQSSVSYNAGNVSIPTSTWILTNALYPTIGGLKQFEDIDNDNIIENDEHVFVKTTGSTITLIDLFKDIDETITSVTFTDRRGDTYEAEVGDLEDSSDYRDVKITGLNNRTTYDFEYMDVYYTINGEDRSQRVRFDNATATGNVTESKYLTIATSDTAASQISGYNTLLSDNIVYQVNVGYDRLTYLVKVDDTTNLDRIEVRGLRGDETYEVKNVKSQDGKESSSKWFAVEISNLENDRNYDFLSLETVYDDNGRERYGTPISLGRDNSTSDVLFPYSTNKDYSYNAFTRTNKDYKSEVWVDSNLKYEQVPGGVRFYGRVKDADSLLEGVSVYINNGGSYERIDDSQIKLEKTYRVVKGIDFDNNGTLDSNKKLVYPFNGADLTATEKNVESASEMVEITITGIDANKSKDFRFDFTTSADGSRVSTINTGTVGVFGSVPTSGTKTQQTITRYASGKAGSSKVEVSTSDVKVSDVTTSTAVVSANIKNSEKEAITVEISGTGVNGVTAKYNVEKNVIDLSGLRPNTEYSDVKLTLKYGTSSTVLTVPTFKTTTLAQDEAGVAGYVSRVYRAFFNREAEKDGLLYWTNKLVSGEETLKGFLGQVSFTPELLEKNLTNTQFVEAMYAIVDRAGEEEGVTFWVSEIEKGVQAGETQAQARASVVSRMLDTDEVREIATKLGIKFE